MLTQYLPVISSTSIQIKLVQYLSSLKNSFSIRNIKLTFLRLTHFLKLTTASRIHIKQQPHTGYTYTKLSEA